MDYRQLAANCLTRSCEADDAELRELLGMMADFWQGLAEDSLSEHAAVVPQARAA